jgi:N-glycosylase/DNA lyase
MKELAKVVRSLMNSEVGNTVRTRVQEFTQLHQKGNDFWFSELCFCILTANSSAILGVKIQRQITPDGFKTLSLEQLTNRLVELGHRFPNRRAEFIVNARIVCEIKDIITRFTDTRNARNWLVKNVKGLGLKEASHFLRNVGYFNLAILDRHIQRVMLEYRMVTMLPKSMTKRSYLAMEEKLRSLAEELDLPIGVLDLYLWYMKTGKVLK